MADDVKKEIADAFAQVKEEQAKQEPASKPDGASAETFAAAAIASAHGVVAATEPELLNKPEPVAGAPEGTVALHPAAAAIMVTSEFVQGAMMQGVHPAQAAAYVVAASLSLLRQLGLSAKDVNDLVIHFNQTWRLMTETKGQLPN